MTHSGAVVFVSVWTMQALHFCQPMGGFSEPVLQLLALCLLHEGGGVKTDRETGRRNRGRSELGDMTYGADSENFKRIEQKSFRDGEI